MLHNVVVAGKQPELPTPALDANTKSSIVIASFSLFCTSITASSFSMASSKLSDELELQIEAMIDSPIESQLKAAR